MPIVEHDENRQSMRKRMMHGIHKIWIVLFTWIMCCKVFAAPLRSQSTAPHAVYGVLQYTDGSHPANPSWTAYITARPGNALTQSSPGSGYYSDTGTFLIQIQPISPYTAGETLHIDFNDGAGATESTDVTLSYSASDNAGTITFQPPSHQITISTHPSGLQITVDGGTYTSPETFSWTGGSRHTISTDSPQNGGSGTRHTFDSWSDGGGQSHSYTVPGSDETVTAYFNTKHYLTVNSAWGSPTGSGWYDEGSTATFSVTSPDVQGAVRYSFDHWSGDFSGPGTSGSISMFSPKTIEAHWKTQYYLDTNENPDMGGDMTPTPPGIWCDEGSLATVEAFPNTASGYIFSGWRGDLQGMTNPTTIFMDGPKTVLALFSFGSHTLTVKIEPGNGGSVIKIPNQKIFTHGDQVSLTAEPHTDWEFERWSGDVTGTTRTISVIIDDDKTIHAHFRTEDTLPPRLQYVYPPGGASAIPQNTSIQFTVTDDEPGYGIDRTLLNVYINGTAIVRGGIDQSGGRVDLRSHSPRYTVQYHPFLNFGEGSKNTVRVIAQDLSASHHTLDSTYTFTIGNSLVTELIADVVDSHGGRIRDETTGIEINVPEGALLDSVEITIGTCDNIPSLPDTVQGIGLAYHFGPDGLQFSEDVIIKIPFSNSDLNEAGVGNPVDLPIYYFLSSRGEWIRLQIFQVINQYVHVKVRAFCYLSSGKEIIMNTDVGIAKENRLTPFSLSDIYPNPFNPETGFSYQLPNRCRVNITIYDLMGRIIKRLIDEEQSAGTYSLRWNGIDDTGNHVTAGIYFLHFQSSLFSGVKKMILLR